MKAIVLVAGVTLDTWFRGTRDERQVTVLNCLDSEAHLGRKLKQTFDYTPSPEEAAELNLPALDGQRITLAIEEIKAASGGRLKMRGTIDRSGLPKGATDTAPKGSQTPRS